MTTFAPVAMQSIPEVARRFGIPDWKIEERQRAVNNPKRYEGLLNAAQRGVRIVFGTDAGSPVVEHDVIVPEMEFMIKVGVVSDALAAIRSATIEAAKLHKLDHKLGSLERGKAADLVVVDGKPDKDLRALEHVEMTYIDGKRLV